MVADTGSKVLGRRLDIYMPSEAACIKFGSKTVKVKVLQVGDGTRSAVKESDQVVKENVAKDLQKKLVGNSATEEDWSKSKVAKTAAQAAAAQTSPSETPAPASTHSTEPPDHL